MFNIQEYPHKCPRCGAYAYVGGAHPGDVKCTDSACMFFDKKLSAVEMKKPQAKVEPVPCDIWDDLDGFFL